MEYSNKVKYPNSISVNDFIYVKSSTSIFSIAFQFRKYSDGNLPINLLAERSTMCNLGNAKLVLGLPTTPWNPLDRK